MDTFVQGEVAPTALVSEHATLGSGVTVGPFSVIHAGVVIGDHSVIGSHCSIGEPLADFYSNRGEGWGPPCVIGADAVVRSHTVIYAGVTAGRGFETGHRVTIREGSNIGEDVRVGTLSDLQGDLTIGRHARIHSSVFIAQTSTVEDFAWLFPGVMLANDPHPPSDTCMLGPTIRRFAAVSARAMVMPGVEVGEHALVGAMSLVTRDVEPATVVAGVPARSRGSVRDVVCKHGVLEQVYPWPLQFNRGYPEGSLPSPSDLADIG